MHPFACPAACPNHNSITALCGHSRGRPKGVSLFFLLAFFPAGSEPPGTPMGCEGGPPSAPQLPWIPTLADPHWLDASVASRWGGFTGILVVQ